MPSPPLAIHAAPVPRNAPNGLGPWPSDISVHVRLLAVVGLYGEDPHPVL
jgi:hypothetical protein